MPTSPTDSDTQPQSLSLSLTEQWTLHHILLDCIEQEQIGDRSDPPPITVYQAFDTLDGGEMQFTAAQLDAIQAVLADYHHTTDWWEVERSQIEQLLHHVTATLDNRCMPEPG